MKTYRFLLSGVGRVGQAFLEAVAARGKLIAERHGLDLVCVGAADRSGVAWSPGGLDLPELVAAKKAGRGVAELPRVGRPGAKVVELIEEDDADVLFEASPADAKTGEPALKLVRTAQEYGLHVVLASKGPVVAAFDALTDRTDWEGNLKLPAIRFSAAVGGGLPIIDVGRRDLAVASIARVEAVLGAERDPSPDLVVLANAVLRFPAELADVEISGAAPARGERRVARAVRVARGYALTVSTETLGPDHPLARLGPDERGAVFETDLHGRVVLSCAGDGPRGAAAAMLKDVIGIAAARP